jgi:hypothetical protein
MSSASHAWEQAQPIVLFPPGRLGTWRLQARNQSSVFLKASSSDTVILELTRIYKSSGVQALKEDMHNVSVHTKFMDRHGGPQYHDWWHLATPHLASAPGPGITWALHCLLSVHIPGASKSAIRCCSNVQYPDRSPSGLRCKITIRLRHFPRPSKALGRRKSCASMMYL